MFQNKKILAVITARGGSKGLPGKNIRPLSGKPLLAYSIEHGKASRYIDRLVVSSDDSKILAVAKKYGAEPLLRPPALARDNALSVPVCRHAVETLRKQGFSPDFVIMLQPTSPIRDPKDIDKAIEMLDREKCDSIVSFCEVEHPPHWIYSTNKQGYLRPFVRGPPILRRQDAPKLYRINGNLYIIRTAVLMKVKGFITSRTKPFIQSREKSIDIDDIFDFGIAGYVIRNLNKNE